MLFVFLGQNIARCYAQDNLGVKKVLASLKNLSKLPIIKFTGYKKLTAL
jgi:hypothetical protein